MSPNNELPFIKDNGSVVFGVRNIINYIKNKGFDLDSNLSDREKADSLAFQHLIQDKLHDALLYTWWLDNENFVNNTRPQYANSLPLMLRYQVPSQLRTGAFERLAKYEQVEKGEESSVFIQARKVYQALDDRLGDKKYIFGKPSTLDALMYAHLAIHAYPSLANPKLFTILTFEFPRLLRYCNHLKATVFGESIPISPNSQPTFTQWVMNLFGGAKSKGHAEEVPMDINEIKEKRVENFKRLMFGLVSFGFFFAYVAKSGIISIEYNDGENNDDDDDDDYDDNADEIIVEEVFEEEEQ